MKVFVSWSGKRSHRVALTLRDWLPAVIQTVDTFVSSEDITKGSRWSSDLADMLQKSSYGIICVTKENVHSPWLNFEAGALSKSVGKSRIFPFLLDVALPEIAGPLGQFQATQYERDDVRKLLRSLNSEAGKKAIEAKRLSDAFEMSWLRLDVALNEIKNTEVAEGDFAGSEATDPERITRDIAGWWKGVAEDVELPDHFGEYRQHLTYKAKVHFEQFGRLLKGKALIEADVDFSISFRGRFLNNEYFQMEWQYPDPGVHGFGIAIMHVLDIGNQMEGSLLFKRLRSDGLALASLALQRASP